jgi:hypothetical protein
LLYTLYELFTTGWNAPKNSMIALRHLVVTDTSRSVVPCSVAEWGEFSLITQVIPCVDRQQCCTILNRPCLLLTLRIVIVTELQ